VCDLRIGAANARFGFPIARTLGNTLSMVNHARLAALIGPARVTDLIFSARLMEAEEMRMAGLLSEILPDHAALQARAATLAATVAGHAPLTMRATKQALRRLSAAARAPHHEPPSDASRSRARPPPTQAEHERADAEQQRPRWAAVAAGTDVATGRIGPTSSWRATIGGRATDATAVRPRERIARLRDRSR
jgi:enoyl-CoA hydratase/carnithine racemase